MSLQAGGVKVLAAPAGGVLVDEVNVSMVRRILDAIEPYNMNMALVTPNFKNGHLHEKQLGTERVVNPHEKAMR